VTYFYFLTVTLVLVFVLVTGFGAGADEFGFVGAGPLPIAAGFGVCPLASLLAAANADGERYFAISATNLSLELLSETALPTSSYWLLNAFVCALAKEISELIFLLVSFNPSLSKARFLLAMLCSIFIAAIFKFAACAASLARCAISAWCWAFCKDVARTAFCASFDVLKDPTISVPQGADGDAMFVKLNIGFILYSL
jgi:hypothetical protein